jgi:hypothetical protein
VRAALILVVLWACSGGSSRTRNIPGDRGPALTVEVLNGSGRPGAARIATRILREAGIDVVYFGNATEGGTLDSTRIIVRRGDESGGERVRAALGAGRVDVQLDRSKLLDVSVLLGMDFATSAHVTLDLHP